jgi:hypothetical protein
MLNAVVSFNFKRSSFRARLSGRAFALIMVLQFVLQSFMPCVWADQLNMDLSSTDRTVSADSLFAGASGSSVSITVNGNTQMVQGGDLITPAEYLAASQVLSGQTQTLMLGAMGNAVGGSFALPSNLAQSISSLAIPQGVLAVHDFASVANLNLTGNFSNSGTFYAVSSSNQVLTANISAANILNNQGGILSSVLPSSGFGGLNLPGLNSLVSNLSLNLTAVQDIVNAGTIMSAANLTAIAGGSIINALPSGVTGMSPVMQAVNNVNLASGIGNILNSGLVTSQLANINIQNQLAQSLLGSPTDLLVNNANGTMQALLGSINIRDELMGEKKHTLLWGGDFIAQEINYNSGTGAAKLIANDVQGVLNINAGESHVWASTSNLQLGTMNITGDPTFYNTAGDVTFNQNISFPGQPLAIVASGNIIALAGASNINTSSGIAGVNGGSITLVAGANFVSDGPINFLVPPFPAPVGPGDTTSNLTITPGPGIGGGSITGGRIDLTVMAGNFLNADGTFPGSNGGNITLVAFEGTGLNSGTISTPLAGALMLSRGANNVANFGGTVTVIAGASAGTSISMSGVQTWNINSTGGAINIATAIPQINGGAVTIFNGGITGGSFSAGTIQNASILMGHATTTTQSATNISITAGQNLTTQSNIGTANGSIYIAALNGDMNLARIGAGVGTVPASIFLRAGGNMTTNIVQCTNNTFVSMSAGGNQILGGQVITDGGHIAVIAGGDITQTGGGNFNSNGSVAGRNGGNVLIAAGLATSYTSGTTFDITAVNASGGAINLPGYNVNSTSGANANGGNVEIYAFAGTGPGSGVVTLTNASSVLTGGNGAGHTSGTITVLAGASSGTSITMGGMQSWSNSVTGGAIVLSTSQPIIAAGPVVITNGNRTSGSFGTGAFQTGSSISLTGATAIMSATNITFTAGMNLTIAPQTGSATGAIYMAAINGDLNIARIGLGVGTIPASIFLRAGGNMTTNIVQCTNNTFVSMSAGGNQILNGQVITDGGHITIVAGGNITQTGGGNINSNGSVAGRNGGNILVAAGLATSYTSGTVFDITAVNAAGGSIVLPGYNATTGGGGNADSGSVQMLAFAGTTPGSGAITFTTITGAGGGAGHTSGNVTILAGGVSGTTISMQGIQNWGNVGSSGDIVLRTAQPTIASGPVVITNGSISSGSFGVGALQNASINISGATVLQSNWGLTMEAGADITTININTVRNGVTLLAGQNITVSAAIGNNITGNVFARANTGNISLGGQVVVVNNGFISMMAAGNITFGGGWFSEGGNIAAAAGGNIIYNAGGGSIDTSPGAGSGGSVFLASGVTVSPLAGTDFQITGFNPSGGIMDLSGTFQISTSGAGAGSNGGRVTIIAAAGTTIGSGVVNLIGRTITTSGSNPGTNGDIQVIAGATAGTGFNSGAITSSGSVVGNTISIMTATPTLTGGPVTISNAVLPNNSFSAGAVQASSVSITGVLWGSGSNITITSGANLLLSGIFGILNQGSTSGGSVNLAMNSAVAFNIGAPGVNGSNSILSNTTGANGNGGIVSIVNNGTGGITMAATGSINVGAGFTNGNGGQITLQAVTGNVTVGGAFTLNGSGTGNGGFLTIISNSATIFNINGAGANSLSGTITANAGGVSGDGGRVTIVNNGTGGINLPNTANISVNATGSGAGGRITLTALNGQLGITAGSFTANGAGSGAGGQIRLTSSSANTFAMNGSSPNGMNGSITVNGGATGAGGLINITANGTGGITLPAANLSATANGNGDGGSITLAAMAGALQITGGLTANGAGGGAGGTISITYADAVNALLIGSAGANSFINGNVNANAPGAGTGGTITFTNNAAGALNISKTGNISASSGSGTNGILNFNKVGQNVTVAGTGTLVGRINATGVNIDINNSSAASTLTINSVVATGTVGLTNSGAGSSILFLAGAPTVSAAGAITINASTVNFSAGSALTTSGASAITFGDLVPAAMTIAVASGSTAAITTNGGTIAFAPIAGQTLTFGLFGGAIASTLNLNGGAVSTTTTNAVTAVSANTTLASNNNIQLNVNNSVFNNDGVVQTSAPAGTVTVASNAGNLIVGGGGAMTGANIFTNSSAGSVAFSQATVTGNLNGTAFTSFTASTPATLNIRNITASGGAVTLTSTAGNLNVVAGSTITSTLNTNITGQTGVNIGTAAGAAVLIAAGVLAGGNNPLSTNMADYTMAAITSAGNVLVTTNAGDINVEDNITIRSFGGSVGFSSSNIVAFGDTTLFAQGGNVWMEAVGRIGTPTFMSIFAVARTTAGTVTIDGQTIPDFNGGGVAIYSGGTGLNLDNLLRTRELSRVSSGSEVISPGVDLTGTTTTSTGGSSIEYIAAAPGKISITNSVVTITGGVLSVDPPLPPGATITFTGTAFTIVGPSLTPPTPSPSSSGSTSTATVSSSAPVVVVATPTLGPSTTIISTDVTNEAMTAQMPQSMTAIANPEILSADANFAHVVSGSCQPFLFVRDNGSAMVGKGGTVLTPKSNNTVALNQGTVVALGGKENIVVETVQGKVVVAKHAATLIESKPSGVVRIANLGGGDASVEISNGGKVQTLTASSGEELVVADSSLGDEELIPVDGISRTPISGSISVAGLKIEKSTFDRKQMLERDALLWCNTGGGTEQVSKRMASLRREMAGDTAILPAPPPGVQRLVPLPNVRTPGPSSDTLNGPTGGPIKPGDKPQPQANSGKLRPIAFTRPVQTVPINTAGLSKSLTTAAVIRNTAGTQAVIEAGNSIHLKAGEILVEANADTMVQAGQFKIALLQGAVALIGYKNKLVKISNLFETKTDSVSLIAGQRKLSLSAGHDLIAGEKDMDLQAPLRDKPVGRRKIRNYDLNASHRATCSEVSHVSLFQYADLLSRLHRSNDPLDKELAAKLVKMAACLTQVTASHGPYAPLK